MLLESVIIGILRLSTMVWAKVYKLFIEYFLNFADNSFCLFQFLCLFFSSYRF